MHSLRRIAFLMAKGMAVVGGVILIALVLVTCVSITGRGLGTLGNASWFSELAPPIASIFRKFAPVTGDFELVEMGMALAIFLFLPWCQVNRGHAAVDLLTTRTMSLRANDVLLIVWELLLTGIVIVITWRLWAGMNDKMLYGETTFLLQWPVWWGYAACVMAGLGACIVALICTLLRIETFLPNHDFHGDEGPS